MKTTSVIIAPVDLDEHSQKVVEYAADMAGRLEAELTVIHVVEPLRAVGDMILGSDSIKSYNEKRVAHADDTLQKLLADHPGLVGKVITGDIVDQIIDFAKKAGAGLIIIGTHGSKGIEKLLLGSVAERVVKNAHCPTLVMNPYREEV